MEAPPEQERQTHAAITASVQRRTVTVEEAAKILGIGRNAAYDAVKRNELPALRIGRRLVIPVAALDRMLEGEGTGRVTA